MSDLSGKRLLVAGASSGVGKAVAIAATRAGAQVAFAARRIDRLAASVEEAGAGEVVPLDVRDGGSVVAAVARARELLGGLDGYVYASGVSPLAEIADLDGEAWREVFDTNVRGAALVAREASEVMDPQGVGAFISSITVGRPRRGLVAYSASKAALDELIAGLRTERRDRRFLRIVVGDTAGTEFGDRFDADRIEAHLPHWIVEGHLFARPMEVEDLADSIVRVLAVAFAHPEVALSDVRLEPAGYLLTLAADSSVLEAIASQDQ